MNSYLAQDWVHSEGTPVRITYNNGKWTSEATQDNTSNLLLPGIVDLHAVLQTPDLTGEHMQHQSKAAYTSGIATLLAMPGRSLTHQYEWYTPPPEQRKDDRTRVYQCVPLTRLDNGNRVPLAYNDLDTTKVKALLISDQDVLDTRSLLRALQLAKTTSLTVILEPNWLPLCRHSQVHQGKVAAQKGLNGVSPAAETIAIQLVLELIRDTGTRIHFTGISSARSVDIIASARKERLAVTADTSVLHLMHTEEVLHDFNSRYKIWPPLRSSEDRQALIKGIQQGTLDAITSYHTPRGHTSKHLPFGSASFGTSTFDNYISSLLYLVNANLLTVQNLRNCCAIHPCQILAVHEQRQILIQPHADTCAIVHLSRPVCQHES